MPAGLLPADAREHKPVLHVQPGKVHAHLHGGGKGGEHLNGRGRQLGRADGREQQHCGGPLEHLDGLRRRLHLHRRGCAPRGAAPHGGAPGGAAAALPRRPAPHWPGATSGGRATCSGGGRPRCRQTRVACTGHAAVVAGIAAWPWPWTVQPPHRPRLRFSPSPPHMHTHNAPHRRQR